MAYTAELIENLAEEFPKVHRGLQDLMLKNVIAGQEAENESVKEHLLHGSARRLSVIRKAIDNIFEIFPPTTQKPLDREKLYDVQINLHAFVMNVSGIFDNWAWAFIQRHQLLDNVGGRHGVGLFNKKTKKFLPQNIKDYLSSKTIVDWQSNYIKEYRDALAHRIPLYIPPAELTNEEGDLYNHLEAQKLELIKEMKWKELDDVYEEQANIGKPSFLFLLSHQNGDTNPIMFHPQILSDGLAIIEFGKLFIDNWEECA